MRPPRRHRGPGRAVPRPDRGHAEWQRRIGQRDFVISTQVLQEFYVNATRKIAEPLDADTAVERIRALSRWPVHAPRAADVVRAATLGQANQLSFWDAMIVHSAAALGFAVMWSEDLNAEQVIAGVEIRNPFA